MVDYSMFSFKCYIVLVLSVIIVAVEPQLINLNNGGENIAIERLQKSNEDLFSFPSFLEFGTKFPNYTSVPSGLEFTCYNREPGYYANPLADCQVYHLCLIDGRAFTFICGVGTIFNQRNFICDHWYNYNCDEAEGDYKYNANLHLTDAPTQPDNHLQVGITNDNVNNS